MKDDNKAFSISYSGGAKDELEQFKKKYSPNKPTEKMKKVRSLDKRVDFIATMLSICIGLFGTAFLISGVIHIITRISSPMHGIIQTAIGIAIISVVPFTHIKVLGAVRSYYGPKILTLIEEIEQNQI